MFHKITLIKAIHKHIRHERAQFSESQRVLDQREAGESRNREETKRQTLSGRFGGQ